MKAFNLLAAIALLVACNSGNDKSAAADSTNMEPTDTVTSYSGVDSSVEFLDSFSNDLVPWLQQTIKSNDVSLRGLHYADNWVEDSLVITTQDAKKDFLQTYESMLVYSPDKKKILDLGSYGSVPVKDKTGKTSFSGEPDTEIALINVDAKKRRRLLYFGPGTNVDHGYWMNDSTVIVTGQTEEKNAVIPIVWKIEIKNNSNEITRYEYSLR